MKKALIIAGIVVVAIGVFFFIDDGPEDGSSVTKTEKFIIASPIDLEQIASISQFRSCMGHDYSGKNSEGEKETNRSMKHYLTTIPELDQSTGKVKAFAPFDGKIASIEDKQNPRGDQVWIRGPSAGSWNFIFFHIDLIPELTKGSDIEAGQLIGYANLADGANFDFGLKSIGFKGQLFETPFKHMTPEVLTEYADYGVTSENAVITKETRDANPCNFGQGSGQDEQVYLE